MPDTELSPIQRWFAAFEVATPALFGQGDHEPEAEREVQLSRPWKEEAAVAAWCYYLSRITGERTVYIGLQKTGDPSPRAVAITVDMTLTTDKYLEDVSDQLGSQSADDVAIRKELHITSSTKLYESTLRYESDQSVMLSVRGMQKQEHLNAVGSTVDGLVHALSESRDLRGIPIMDEDEREKILGFGIPPSVDYPELPVHKLFEIQADRRSEHAALLFSGKSISYESLNRRANQLAHYLMDHDVVPGDRVAIFMNRGVEAVIAILGVLKAGAVYVPLDMEFPRERLLQMLEDARPALLINQDDGQAAGWGLECPLVSFDALENDRATYSDENPNLDISPDASAYIMFTSGSTGRPKGVEVVHRGIVRLLFSAGYVPLSEDTVLLHMAAVSFDAATFELWGALLHGGSCVISASRVPTLEEITSLLKDNAVNTCWMTASIFNLVVSQIPDALSGVKYLLTGGEVLSQTHVELTLEQLPDLVLINAYGPTENTTFSTTYTIDPELFQKNLPVPIGSPIGNSTCYILDQDQCPVPIGVPGELYVGGDGLAKGYINQPDLTAARFVPDPFRDGEQNRMYKTGDLGYWGDDGLTHFIGRIDQQIKIRGFRIELQDIISALTQCPGIIRAEVETHEDELHGKWIAAYFEVQDPEAFEVLKAEQFVRKKLPQYMVPSAFVIMDEWPHTPSGKLDRKALPKPDFQTHAQSKTHVPPGTPSEKELARLWARTLEISDPGIDDDFFESGGNSIRGVHLFHLIQQQTGKDLPLALLTQNPTIRSLALLIDDKTESYSVKGCRALQVIQEGSAHQDPIVMIHGGAGNVVIFRDLARNLGPEQPLYAFQWPGWDGASCPGSIPELASIYKDELLQFMPRRSYRLGGHCIGGLISMELSHQLKSEGISVDGPLLVSDCPNLFASDYLPKEPELDADSYSSFMELSNTLKSMTINPEKWIGPEGARPLSGWVAKIKSHPAILRTVRTLRMASDILRIRRCLFSGNKVPVEARPFYASHSLVSAARRYRPTPYSGPVLYFRSACMQGSQMNLQGWWNDPFMGFREVCSGSFQGVVVGGGHNDVLKEAVVAERYQAFDAKDAM